ncbi:MAG: AI-2E family transporter [Candidatus Nanohaloarchaea archaeon]
MDLERKFLTGVAGVLVFLAFLMALPFLGYLIAAAVLAFMLRPLQKRLEKYIRPSIASGLLIVVFVGAVMLPFGLGLNAVIGDIGDISSNIDRVEAVNFTETEDLVLQHTGQEIDIEQEIQQNMNRAASLAIGGFSQALNVIAGVAIGSIIMIFALFYLLRDREKLIVWVKSVTPVERELQDKLYSKASLMTWSVLKGHVLVAIVTGLIAGLGLYMTGVPNVAFWTFMMILLAFIPLIGAFMVWAPASLYLFIVSERLVAGLFLFMYGLIIVSLSDNILRPYLVDRRADIHPAAILIGVIGGVYVFGAVGLFIGPVIFGFGKTVLEVLREDL